MAKTIEQIISNQAQHVERSKMGFHAACEAGNGALAAFNLDQGFRAQLMQGLIRWRSGPADPVNDLKEAVQQISQGIKRLGKIGVPEGTTSVPVELAGIVSFLVKIPFTSEATTSLLSDRLLDVVLVDGLRGGWNDAAWQLGMTTLQKLKGSGLCVETYSTYAQLEMDPKIKTSG